MATKAQKSKAVQTKKEHRGIEVMFVVSLFDFRISNGMPQLLFCFNYFLVLLIASQDIGWSYPHKGNLILSLF